MRRSPALLALFAAGAVALGGCGSSSDSSGSAPSGGTNASAPASSGASAPSGGPSDSSAAANVVGTVTLVKGKPQGGAKRISTKAGQPAVLMVTSDAATEIHVHGADRYVKVPANQPTAVDVSEASPGAYEVEDHASDSLLVQLRVS